MDADHPAAQLANLTPQDGPQGPVIDNGGSSQSTTASASTAASRQEDQQGPVNGESSRSKAASGPTAAQILISDSSRRRPAVSPAMAKYAPRAWPRYTRQDPSPQPKGGPRFGKLSQVEEPWLVDALPLKGLLPHFQAFEDRGWPGFLAVGNATPLRVRKAAAGEGSGVWWLDGYKQKLREIKLDIPVGKGKTIGARLWRQVERQPGNVSLLVLYMHSRGWVLGDDSRDMLEILHTALIPNITVVSLAYNQAPDSRGLTVLRQCVAATLWCRDNCDQLRVLPNSIVMMGTGAGANLAMCVTNRLYQRKIRFIMAQVLSFPPTCHPLLYPPYMEIESPAQNHSVPGSLTAAQNEFYWDCRLGLSEDEILSARGDPWHSPLLADDAILRGLPNTLMQLAGLDPRRDEGLEYANRLLYLGVAGEVYCYTGMPPRFPARLPNCWQSCHYFETQTRYLRACFLTLVQENQTVIPLPSNPISGYAVDTRAREHDLHSAS